MVGKGRGGGGVLGDTLGVGWKVYKIRRELQESVKMILKGEMKGKEAQKLLTTMIDVYTGLSPQTKRKAIPPTEQPVSSKVIQTLPQATVSPQQMEEGTSTPKKDDTQIEAVVMEVLKKGSEVRKLGKYYEKQQKQVEEV